jgi:hypothetical protein
VTDVAHGDPTQEEDPTLDDVFVDVFRDAVTALDAARVPVLVMGGISSTLHGRERWTHDIDLFLRERHARWALDVLAERGFDVEETYWDWLFKAEMKGITIDLIFRSSGGIRVDAEMFDRSTVRPFCGVEARVLPPEDLLVIKAVVHDEHLPRHWYDALGVLGRCDLDWDYLLRRARRHGARRVLSLLVYAQSNDLIVPNRIITQLVDDIYRS